MSFEKSSLARSSWTIFSVWRLVMVLSGMSSHRGALVEAGFAPFAGLHHLAEVLDGVPCVDMAQVKRREAKAQDVGGLRVAGAEVADHAARDHGLHDRIGTFLAGEADLAAAQRGVARRH